MTRGVVAEPHPGNLRRASGTLPFVPHLTARAAAAVVTQTLGVTPHLGARGCRALVALALALVTACSSGPSESECERLRDKLVELEFSAMGAKALTSEARAQLAKQKQETSESVAERFKESCLKKTPKDLVDCALAATSLEQVKQCDEKK